MSDLKVKIGQIEFRNPLMVASVGETAPLLMVGMVAFVMEIPGGPLDPATGLPSQIYLWSESAERGFIEKTSASGDIFNDKVDLLANNATLGDCIL